MEPVIRILLKQEGTLSLTQGHTKKACARPPGCKESKD